MKWWSRVLKDHKGHRVRQGHKDPMGLRGLPGHKARLGRKGQQETMGQQDLKGLKETQGRKGQQETMGQKALRARLDLRVMPAPKVQLDLLEILDLLGPQALQVQLALPQPYL